MVEIMHRTGWVSCVIIIVVTDLTLQTKTPKGMWLLLVTNAFLV